MISSQYITYIDFGKSKLYYPRLFFISVQHENTAVLDDFSLQDPFSEYASVSRIPRRTGKRNKANVSVSQKTNSFISNYLTDQRLE